MAGLVLACARGSTLRDLDLRGSLYTSEVRFQSLTTISHKDPWPCLSCCSISSHASVANPVTLPYNLRTATQPPQPRSKQLFRRKILQVNSGPHSITVRALDSRCLSLMCWRPVTNSGKSDHIPSRLTGTCFECMCMNTPCGKRVAAV
jgi:hypothetical protein